jgi:hypothetical protein
MLTNASKWQMAAKICLGVVLNVTYAARNAAHELYEHRAEQNEHVVLFMQTWGSKSGSIAGAQGSRRFGVAVSRERAVRRMGKIELLIFALALVFAFMAIFTPKYL